VVVCDEPDDGDGDGLGAFGDGLVAEAFFEDAYVTAALLRRCLQHATVDELIDCSARPVLLSKFWFGEHAMKPISDIPEGYLSWITGKDLDEDVLYTARCELADRRAPFSVSQQRARSHGGNDAQFLPTTT
jgi:hypothetical protein